MERNKLGGQLFIHRSNFLPQAPPTLSQEETVWWTK